MSLIPRDSLFDIDRFFNDFWAPATREQSGGSFFSPRVDIREKDNHYEISAELPGVDKKDIHVHVHNGLLTIEAELEQEDKEEKEGRILRQERRYGRFQRSFNLGGDVHEEDIKAQFKDGVLTLEAPKVKPETPVQRRIEVK
jgi:HSP20 family protein